MTVQRNLGAELLSMKQKTITQLGAGHSWGRPRN